MTLRIFIAGLGLFVAGCTAETAHTDRELPSMEDLGRPKRRTDLVDRTGPTFRTLIHRIDLPFDSRLDAAWSLLDTSALPPAVAARWHENGLAAGVLAPAARQQFIAALPPHYGTREQMLIGAGGPVPLSGTARSRAPVTVYLPPAGGQAQPLKLVGGRCRFLVRALHLGDEVAVELTPHHHTNRGPGLAQLFAGLRRDQGQQPRPGESRQAPFPGRILDELTLQAPLATGHTLVVAAARRPDEPEAEEDADEGDTNQEQNDSPAPAAAPRPANQITGDLGRVLFTASRAGRPIQMIFLFERPASTISRARPAAPAAAGG